MALIGLIVSCSLEQNTITASIYHNTTARFNGYFYANEKIREIEKVILKSLDDDHNQILRLFPKLDTVLAKSYAKDTEEVIKMASLSIQRHPNSRWVYRDYVLVGLARLYSGDFQNAIQTFKYVNTKSTNIDIRHEALIHLIRTFTEQEQYDKADEAIRFLEKEKLSKINQKKLYLEKAYYAQIRFDYNSMVQSLTKADSLLNRKDRKGRIYFIIGQVYQKLGFGAEAYNYYRKCLATSPEYEIDFYARLNMAQVAKLDDSRDVKLVRRQFNKLLTDAKNAEFRDKIYFELGEFERKQNHLNEAIADYKLAAHAGKSKRIQGSAYLRAGQLYFDSLKKYELAKAYYDSAVAALPKEYDNYDLIKKRQEVLGDFVKYTQTIQWQDSLLYMAGLDSVTLRKKLDSAIASRTKPEIGKKKKKRANTASGNADSTNPFFQNDSNGTSTSETEGTWYFSNQSAVALGQTEFQRVWGNITLEDNWRRSNKSGSINATQELANPATENVAVTTEKKEAVKVDEAAEIYKKLPYTAEQKQEALALIEEAYFNLGDLYYLQLNEKQNAAEVYTKLLNRFPETEHAPEVLYKMYLIAKENGSKGEQYAQLLKEKYPDSQFTKILINPNYLQETRVAAEKQQVIYKEAYQAYQDGNLRVSQEIVNKAKAVGETSFTPQLELLEILITGKTEDVTRYQFELAEFIKKYPDHELKTYAENLLNSSKAFLEKAKGIRFVNSLEEPHYLVIMYKTEDKITDELTKRVEDFDKQYFKEQNLKTTNLRFNETRSLTLVSEFATKAPALDYFDKLKPQVDKMPSLTKYKFDIFVVTKDNFQIFYRTKALDEYLTFFDRNYQTKNQ